VRLPILGAHKFFDLVRVRQQAEEIALLFRRQSKHERGRDESFENGCVFSAIFPGFARAQSGSVHNDIDFLCLFDLKNFRDRPAAPRRCFPVNFIVAVAGHILAQFFELASFAQLPLRMDAERAAIQKQRRHIFSFGQQIWIDANFRLHGNGFARRPKSERRRCLDKRGIERITAALKGRARDGDSRPLGFGGQGGFEFQFLGLDFARPAKRDAHVAFVLPLIAKSGRGVLDRHGDQQGFFGFVWDDGPPWRFDLEIGTENGTDPIRVAGSFVRNGHRLDLREPVLLLSRGFLFTETSLARLDVGAAFPWIAQLRTFGPIAIPHAQSATLVETVARSGLDPAALPPDLRYDVVEGTPRPRVRVSRPERQNPYALRQDLRATLQFEYDGAVVEGPAAAAAYDAANRRLVRRDRAAEQAAIDRLHELGFRYTWSHFESRQLLGVSPEQFPKIVHTLVSEGWRVEAEGRAFRPAVGMRLEVSSGIDWFDLHGAVDFGDGRSAPFPQLLAAIARGEDVVVLDDGSVGLLPEEWLQRYAGIAGFGNTEGDAIRFGRSQAALLDALLAAQPAIAYDETFARIRSELQTFSGIVAEDPPRSFRGTLREYQRDALGWFSFLRRFEFGGCLADDMGLGKTVMVLALLEARRQLKTGEKKGPSIVVVPRSLVFNWRDEATRFAPRLNVIDYTGVQRDRSGIRTADVVLTTYGTLRRDAAALHAIEFDYAILDEAQAIKNAATASAKAARLLRARYRLALSGTPIENHLGELWSLFEFLNPGVLGSAKAFQRASTVRSRGGGDVEWLARALRPFILRRTKEQVAPELPRRTEQTLQCELEPAQRRHYDELRAHYRETLLARIARDGVNRSKMQILEALLRLRQAACHSALIDPSRAHEPSAKFEVLIPRLLEVIAEGHKALVFSQFTSLLALLRPRLDALHTPYEYLDGRTRDRAARVERFQTDSACRLFLISLKAGGLGLNLTAAEYVFLLDPWWNPAVEAQAIDRAHRIGQSRHVFAYRLLARDTVEEKVAELQQTKRDLADAILNADAGLIRSLNAEDLEMLLS